MEPIAHPLAEVVGFLSQSGIVRCVQSLRERIKRRTLPVLRVGKAVRLLDGDWQYLLGSEPMGIEVIGGTLSGRRLLSAKDVGQMLSVTTRHVQLLCARGELPGECVSDRWILRSEDLRAWLLERRVPCRGEEAWRHVG